MVILVFGDKQLDSSDQRRISRPSADPAIESSLGAAPAFFVDF